MWYCALWRRVVWHVGTDVSEDSASWKEQHLASRFWEVLRDAWGLMILHTANHMFCSSGYAHFQWHQNTLDLIDKCRFIAMNRWSREISGFRRFVVEPFCLLRRYAAYVGSFHWRFGTSYRFRLQRSNRARIMPVTCSPMLFLDCLILEEEIYSLSRNVDNCQHTLRNIVEERRSQHLNFCFLTPKDRFLLEKLTFS